MSTPEIKAQIRQDVIQKRRHLPIDAQLQAAQHVCAQINALSLYKKAHHVACYRAHGGEIDLAALWQPFPDDKTFYFPSVSSENKLHFLPVTAYTPFQANTWRILEPQVDLKCAINPEILQVFFIPVVAFDMKGTRLGMGGGYYDRYLATPSKAIRIGIAYEFQKQPSIPIDPWDQPLHGVITETQIYWFSKPDLL